VKKEIVVALIALLGTVLAAIIGNWGKLFPEKVSVVVTENTSGTYPLPSLEPKKGVQIVKYPEITTPPSNKDYAWLEGAWAMNCDKNINLSFQRLIAPTQIEARYPESYNTFSGYTTASTYRYEIIEQDDNLIFRKDNGNIDTYQKIGDKHLRYVSRRWDYEPVEVVNADYYKCTN